MICSAEEVPFDFDDHMEMTTMAIPGKVRRRPRKAIKAPATPEAKASTGPEATEPSSADVPNATGSNEAPQALSTTKRKASSRRKRAKSPEPDTDTDDEEGKSVEELSENSTDPDNDRPADEEHEDAADVNENQENDEGEEDDEGDEEDEETKKVDTDKPGDDHNDDDAEVKKEQENDALDDNADETEKETKKECQVVDKQQSEDSRVLYADLPEFKTMLVCSSDNFCRNRPVEHDEVPIELRVWHCAGADCERMLHHMCAREDPENEGQGQYYCRTCCDQVVTLCDSDHCKNIIKGAHLQSCSDCTCARMLHPQCGITKSVDGEDRLFCDGHDSGTEHKADETVNATQDSQQVPATQSYRTEQSAQQQSANVTAPPSMSRAHAVSPVSKSPACTPTTTPTPSPVSQSPLRTSQKRHASATPPSPASLIKRSKPAVPSEKSPIQTVSARRRAMRACSDTAGPPTVNPTRARSGISFINICAYVVIFMLTCYRSRPQSRRC